MLGVLVGLGSATANALTNYYAKVLKNQHPFVLAWIRITAAVPVLFLVVTLFDLWTIPSSNYFLFALAVIMPLEVFAQYANIKSLHLAPLSLIAPLASLSTVFLLPLGLLFLGESLSVFGILGVFIILIGAFLLGQETGKTWLYAIRARMTNLGVLLAIAAAISMALSVVATKFSFMWVHPITGAFYLMTMLSLILTPPALYYWQKTESASFADNIRIMLFGIFSGFTILSHHWGLSLLPAAYFISLKRLSILINVVMGRALLQEENFLTRFFGASLMFIGVVLIALGSIL